MAQRGLGCGVLAAVLVGLVGCGGGGGAEVDDAPSVAAGVAATEEAAVEPTDVESDRPRGVVVEEIGAGSALEKAGLQVGDLVLSWRRLPNPPANPEEARGELQSPFDWMWMEIEQAPRGTVVLTVRRADEEEVLVVEPGLWEGRVRPFLSGEMLTDYERGLERLEAEDLEGVEQWWKEVAEVAGRRGSRDVKCWVFLRLEEVWTESGLRDLDRACEWLELAVSEAPTVTSQVMVLTARGDLLRKFNTATSYAAAGEAYTSALNLAEDLVPLSIIVARICNKLGILELTQDHISTAINYFSEARDILQKNTSRSILLGKIINNLGNSMWRQGRLREAESLYRESLALCRDVQCSQLSKAKSTNNLANVLLDMGESSLAERLYTESYRILESMSNESEDMIALLGNLGALKHACGDLHSSLGYYSEALSLELRRGRKSRFYAGILIGMGNIYWEIGDLDVAHNYLKRTLKYEQERAPSSLDMSYLLNSLGNISSGRYDFEAAHMYYQRSLDIRERLAPSSLVVAASLNSLGNLAWKRGDFETAGIYHQRAMAIGQSIAPNSLDVALSFHNLGLVARSKGDFELAARYLESSLGIRRAFATQGLRVADSFGELGIVSLQRADFGAAQRFLQYAMNIYKRVAPESTMYSNTIKNMGLVYLSREEYRMAAEYFQHAIDELEKRIAHLGGSQALKANFLANYGDYYRDLIEALLQLHCPEDAFHTLERSRAQSFLALLAERHLLFEADLPPDLASRRERLLVRHDRAYQQLMESAQATPEEYQALQAQLRDIQRELGDIREEIRRTSPRFAALQYPQPLDLEGARQALDPGTVLLSYSVGPENTVLFVVPQQGGLAVEILPLGEEELRRQVTQMRTLIAEGRPGSAVGAFRGEQLKEVSRRLYQTLIAPVAGELEGAERLLILPDSALHTLPWGALVRDLPETDTAESAGEPPAEPGRGWQYLIEWKPLHIALSATVYAELKESRRRPGARGPPLLQAAFGDPLIPERFRRAEPESIEDVRVRSAAERGFDFRPLPATRLEVEGIARLFGDDARAYLGAEATEEHAKSAGPQARYLHFATHGHLDERFPLNSALVLTLPETFDEDRDNGLLQVWEIFERVRLNADLVALSACESALGEELGGEGLIGLTRAFQYAGARSVVASLWQVADASTAELMLGFYRHLRAGLPKDEALRAAQLELIRGTAGLADAPDDPGAPGKTDASTPYAWAPFQLYGDWR